MQSQVACRADSVPPSARELFAAFQAIGLSGFGGVLPWARLVLVERRGWLSPEEFNETLALCQSLPGPNIVNMSVVVGGRFAGLTGAIAAVIGLVAAPAAIAVVLGALYGRFGGWGHVPGMIAMLGAAAAGLVAATAAKMARPLIRQRPLSATAAMALAWAGIVCWHTPLYLVLPALTPIGLFAARVLPQSRSAP